MGVTTFSVVPGTTVLLTTTTWYDFLSFSRRPMLRLASRMKRRSILPSSSHGVGTQMNEMSVFAMAIS